MAEIKFSCGQCGQHISCDQAWSGHQIQCPACQTKINVPHAVASAAAAPKSLVPEPPAAAQTKLSAGLTQVARATPTAGVAPKRIQPRPPGGGNPAIKYAVVAVVLLVAGGAALKYLPGVINQVQGLGSSTTSVSGPAPASGAAGPLGEVNGAMDVSDALDGGGSSRPRPGTARAAMPASGAQPTNGVGGLRRSRNPQSTNK